MTVLNFLASIWRAREAAKAAAEIPAGEAMVKDAEEAARKIEDAMKKSGENDAVHS